jgi:hypothetical protein
MLNAYRSRGASHGHFKPHGKWNRIIMALIVHQIM